MDPSKINGKMMADVLSMKEALDDSQDIVASAEQAADTTLRTPLHLDSPRFRVIRYQVSG
jgi:hypothetical protein